MSAVGQKRKWPRWNGMSVLPFTTDIVRPPRHVRFAANNGHSDPKFADTILLKAPQRNLSISNLTIADHAAINGFDFRR
jgi:hypothetical protein